VAEAGVGKSRLFYEFKATSQSGWMMLEGLSVPHGRASAYLPVVELLHAYFRISAGDDQRTRREKINGRIVTLDLALEDTRPYLFALLGLDEGDNLLGQMDVQTRGRRTQEAIKRVLLRESLNQPLMLVFEDLHWIDDETRALLNLLADSIGTCRVLLLVNYRPEYSHPWGSKTYYTQLRLDPLGKENADEMLTTLLGSDAELAPLRRLMAEKTEGNPLFMEEIYLGLLEDGTLARNGDVKLVRPLASLRIPPTVEDILAARIDRLPADEKKLLQTLAVIGKDFQLGVVRAVSGEADDALRARLNNLQLAEFIYEQPAMDDLDYTFKHDLTRQVAYRSLLNERRRVLHERAGEAIEIQFSDHLDDHLTELAYHFTQSGNASKAVRYLTLVGKQALGRSAFAESQAHLQNGLEWVKRVVDEIERSKLELEILLSLEDTQRYARGVGGPEAAALLGRADELCEQVGSDVQRFSVLLGMRDVLVSRGDDESAIDKCRLALELAQRTNDPEMLQAATGFTGFTLFTAGRLLEGLQQSQRALELTRRIEGKRSFLSLRAEMLGYPKQAEKAAGEALTRARQMTHPTALLAAQGVIYVYLSLKMPTVARTFAEEAAVPAERSGFNFVSALWRGRLGSAIAGEGKSQLGLRMIRSALEELGTLAAMRIRGPESSLLCSSIEALSLACQFDEAVAEADSLLANRSNLARYLVGHVYFLKGKAVLGRDRSAFADAEACFRKAIETTKSQSAKWLELHATTSLARLLRDTNRRDEARTMLAEIYNWFTEGFDTADLKEAKALLEELSN
jgi:tetratricopeptide (TPR) repeat protein